MLCRQVNALLRKSWQLRKRKVGKTIAEIFVPVFLFGLFILFHYLADQGEIAVRFDRSYAMDMGSCYDRLLLGGYISDDPGIIAISPASNPLAQQLYNTLTTLNPSSPLQTPPRLFNNDAEIFNLRDEIFEDDDPNNVLVSISFNTDSTTLYDYTIRANRNDAPDTRLPKIDNYARGFDEKGYTTQLRRFINSLQCITDHLILQNKQVLFNHPLANKQTYFSVLTKGFPTPRHNRNLFNDAAGDFIGLCLCLGFIMTVSNITSGIVEEKELRVKEGMKMMGLTDAALYLSWIIQYVILFVITCLLIAIFTSFNLYQHSNPIFIFLFYYIYCLSVFSVAFFFASLFDKSKVASAMSSILFLALFFVNYGIDPDTSSRAEKILGCLSPSVCLSQGATLISKLEAAGIGIQFNTMSTQYDRISFTDIFILFLVDIIIYYWLGVYLQNVLPSVYGIRKSICYCFRSKDRQQANDVDSPESMDNTMDELRATSSFLMQRVEPAPADLIGKELIKIRNLRKVFDTPTGEFTAVRNVNIDMYEGQIFSLLGHNGAGKTTTFNMLTGLYMPTTGTAFINGLDMRSRMADIRKIMGVCPQHDILYPLLTVYEHLQLFAAIKGVESNNLHQDIMDMIEEVGLGSGGDNKANSFAGTLSGGQKRKLSVAIALFGGSKVVFLDEPSSGMDVASQRDIWNILMRAKKDRLIVLTTHSMEEAELGDRIAIMSHGSVRCNGSSLFLKKLYGVGYTLNISKDVSKNKFLSPQQREQIDKEIIDLVLGKYPFTELVSDAGGEISFRCPMSKSAEFPDMFDDIDRNKERLNITTFSVSVTTLTEVFLKVGHEEVHDDEAVAVYANKSNQLPPPYMQSQQPAHFPMQTAVVVDAYGNPTPHEPYSAPPPVPPRPAVASHPHAVNNDSDVKPLVVSDHTYKKGETFTTPEIFNEKSNISTTSSSKLLLIHTKALFLKRLHYAKRDRASFVWQVLYPSIILFLGVFIMWAAQNDNPPTILLSPAYYNPQLLLVGGNLPSAQMSYTDEILKLLHVPPTMVTVNTANPTAAVQPEQMDQYLLDTIYEDKRYGAYVFNQNVGFARGSGPATATDAIYAVVYFNTTTLFGLPSYWNGYVNVLANTLNIPGNSFGVNFRYQTFKWSKRIKQLIKSTHAIFLAIAMSFVPAALACYIVKESTDKVKHLHVISGVSTSAYWIANYLWDVLNFILPYIMIIIILLIFGDPTVENVGIWLSSSVILWLFIIAAIPFTYCLTFLFDSHTTAQSTILSFNFLSSIVLLVTSMILRFIESTRNAQKVLVFFFRVLPGFCLGEAYNNMYLRREYKLELWDLDCLGWPVIYLIVQAFVFSLVLYFIQRMEDTKSISKLGCCASKEEKSASISLQQYAYDNNVQGEDSDVAAERARLNANDTTDDDIVVLKSLRKVYPPRMGAPPHIAVHNLTYAVKRGECFGFLGANGAGKTTTIRMMTADEFPTSGSAMLSGYDIINQPDQVRQLIGYCPQFDALLDLLTAREHLTLYARIKCIPTERIEEFTNAMIEMMDLTHLADRPAGTYSGGNKRKLSVGIALIGNPPIVFLDEPSTGMDPMARRSMWNFIESTMKNRSVILTTHSMEECEALCGRLGVMVKGRLKCLGSSQHLKNKFGRGYQVFIQRKSGASQSVKDFMFNSFQGVELLEEHGHNLQFSILKAGNPLSYMFRTIENGKDLAGIEAYSVSDTNLEQIFIQFVNQGDKEEAMNASGPQTAIEMSNYPRH